MTIKNLVFDLGGVLLDIDYHRPVKEFTALGFTGFDKLYSQAAASELFEQLETGKVSNENFIQTVQGLAPKPLTAQQVTDAWCSILDQFRVSSLAHLPILAERYNLYLLSNTNSIHLNRIQQLYQNTTGLPLLDDCFIKAYYSHLIGLRKPEQAIYDFVLSDAGLLAETTLFIDDSPQNISTAADLGWQTVLLQPGQYIEQLGL